MEQETFLACHFDNGSAVALGFSDEPPPPDDLAFLSEGQVDDAISVEFAYDPVNKLPPIHHIPKMTPL